MFKTLIALSFLTLSVNAMAAFELYYKFDNIECKIANNKVHLTMGMLKGEMSFTTSKDISLTGVEEVAKRAAAQSTGVGQTEEINKVLTIDGEKFSLHHSDSLEASSLIYLMGHACK